MFWQNKLVDIRFDLFKEITATLKNSSDKNHFSNLLLLCKTSKELEFALNSGMEINAWNYYFVKNFVSRETFFYEEKSKGLDILFKNGLNNYCLENDEKNILFFCEEVNLINLLIDNGFNYNCENLLDNALSQNNWDVSKELIDRGFIHKNKINANSLITTFLRLWVLWDLDTLEVVGNYLYNNLTGIEKEDLSLNEMLWFIKIELIKNNKKIPEFLNNIKYNKNYDLNDNSLLLPNDFNKELFYWACNCNDVYVVRYLLNKVSNKDFNKEELILQKDDRIDIVKSSKTILHSSVQNQSIDIIKILLNIGFDPNLQDYKGRTPLHFINQLQGELGVKNFNINEYNIDFILALFLDFNADPNILDNNNNKAVIEKNVNFNNKLTILELHEYLTNESVNRLLREFNRLKMIEELEKDGVFDESNTKKRRKI